MALVLRFANIPAATKALVSNGRAYQVSGNYVDIPHQDATGVHPDQAARLGYVCPTADRPVNVPGQANWPPARVYDSTLGKEIYLVPGSNPASWTDINGAAV
jgi:hypothetical protein